MGLSYGQLLTASYLLEPLRQGLMKVLLREAERALNQRWQGGRKALENFEDCYVQITMVDPCREPYAELTARQTYRFQHTPILS